ncbi:MAG: sialate O-acetylesterase [Verrucomicrobia bacterium]|nr:sialate O-acetylesterase [Verrucomicrobiota bacterium]
MTCRPSISASGIVKAGVPFLLSSLLLAGSGCAATREAARKVARGYTGPRENLDVYLLIGQSNMAGRAPVERQDRAAVECAYVLNNFHRWARATNPLNRYSTIRKVNHEQGLGPGYTFAEAMCEADFGGHVGLVVNARGGSSIAEWRKGSEYYDEAVRRARIARETGVLKGVLWHQGESDLRNAGYLEELSKLVENLRKDLDSPDLPFVAGKLRRGKAVNKQLAELPLTVPYTAVVEAEDLTMLRDGLHFDSASARTLGRRYADAMLKLHEELGWCSEVEMLLPD